MRVRACVGVWVRGSPAGGAKGAGAPLGGALCGGAKWVRLAERVSAPFPHPLRWPHVTGATRRGVTKRGPSVGAGPVERVGIEPTSREVRCRALVAVETIATPW